LSWQRPYGFGSSSSGGGGSGMKMAAAAAERMRYAQQDDTLFLRFSSSSIYSYPPFII